MKFAEWADQYGPIYQQTMMGKCSLSTWKSYLIADLLDRGCAYLGFERENGS